MTTATTAPRAFASWRANPPTSLTGPWITVVPRFVAPSDADRIERCDRRQAHAGGLRDINAVGDRGKQFRRNLHHFGECP